MTSLNDLIQRVEQGEGADRGLDGLVWKSLVEKPGDVWREFEDTWCLQWPDDTVAYDMPPQLTTSLDAVVSLIEQKIPGWHWSVSQQVGGFFRGNLWNHGHKVEVYKLATTAPRAILAAALKAIDQARTLADANSTNPLSEGRERS